jgi:tripartite-type tricarboxylate transporter receptor subunit TctC
MGRLTMIRAMVVGLGASVLMSLGGLQAQAEDAAAFYRGNTIRFIVGSGTGGGYDLFARLLAPHVGARTGATVIVENLPGAGGLIALNREYAAKPDGLQVMIVNGVAAAMSQIIEMDSVRYDLAKFGLLGIVNAEPWVWLVSAQSKYKSAREAIDDGQQITWGGSGIISGLSDGAAMTCDALGLKCRIVSGYPGSSEVAIALGRGEVDALYVSELPAQNYVASGLGRNIAAMSRQRLRTFPDVPTIFEIMKLTPEQTAKINFRIAIDELGRIFVVPPDTPRDRLAYLQGVFRDVMLSPEVIAEVEKRNLYIDYRSPAETQALITSIFKGLTPEMRRQVKDVATGRYR